MLIGANAGTPRHSLAIDYAIRPLFTYLHASRCRPACSPRPATGAAGGDGVRTLPDRIDRGARSSPTSSRGATVPSLVSDPFALERPFGHLIGGLAGE